MRELPDQWLTEGKDFALKVKIISDTTCDLPEQLLREYNITLLPLHITKGEQSLLDGVQITPSDIFSYVDAGGEICTTASINPQEYADAFAAYRAAYDAVIVITIGSGFSSCYQNACAAASQFEQVYVVDSANLSSGQGLLVLLAAQLVQMQLEPQQICQKLNEAVKDADASFILDRLDYMKKGGRCSSVTALGANLLKLKPCIEVKNGKMSVGKKYRGSFERVIEQYTADRLQDYCGTNGTAIVVHPAAQAQAVAAAQRVLEQDGRFEQILVARAGCTVACHCGPNTIGVMFFRNPQSV